jgi:hypothetical protein
MQRKTGADLSRKDFLKLGGAGLAGAALLGTAGCGSGGSGSGDLVLYWGPDDTGSPQALPPAHPAAYEIPPCTTAGLPHKATPGNNCLTSEARRA